MLNLLTRQFWRPNRFCGCSNKCNRPVKLSVSAHSHIKDAIIWTLFMLQWHIKTLLNYNIIQDVERECLNQLNVCLINILYIYSVLHISFMAVVTMANLHWKSHNLFALLFTVSFQIYPYVLVYQYTHILY